MSVAIKAEVDICLRELSKKRKKVELSSYIRLNYIQSPNNCGNREASYSYSTSQK